MFISNVGTVHTLCILNVGTVPRLFILDVGIVPTISPTEVVHLNDLHYLSLRQGTPQWVPWCWEVHPLEGCRSPPEIATTSTASATVTNSDLLFNELVDNVVKEGSILGSI